MSTIKARTASSARTKAADLERVRNNQRRCRARRKEYIAELEDRLRQYESTSGQSFTDTELQRLVKENDSLKRLLWSLGLGDEFVKAYSKAFQIAPEISRARLNNEFCCQASDCSSASPSLGDVQFGLIPSITREIQAQDLPLSSSIGAEAPAQDSLQFFESSTQADVVLPLEPFNFPTISTFPLGSLQTEIQPQKSVQSTGDSLMRDAFSSAMPADDTSDTTTLCSLAFSLVLKNNMKGYSAADLDLKLQAGYRHSSTPFEGCRIDNKVLFNVLAEIS